MFWLFFKHYMDGDVAELPPARTPAPKPRAAHSTRPKSRSRANAPAHHAPKQKNSPTMVSSQFGTNIACVLDAELRCHFLSQNWEEVSGFSAEEELGENLRDRIAPDHLRKVGQYLADRKVGISPVRFQMKYSDGQWHWCDLSIRNITDGDSPRFQCVLRDISELVATQAKLQKAKLEADLATKSRSEFLANMSHELRTPLNAILGFAQMMENGTFGEVGHPKYKDYVTNIQASGETLLSRINDLLEIATIDSGRLELNEAPADLEVIIRQAIEFHSHRAFCGEVTLQHRLRPTPLIAVVDRIRILQVLTNVLSNAIKFNRPGGIVDMRTEMRRDGGIDIVIEDNGGGIAASQLENILFAFRQDNSFFARSRDCVGLGLALSKEIVKMHNGRIMIESEPGKGTLLTIRLPKERTVRFETEKSTAESFLAPATD